jgi:hypothetical protein
MRLMLLLGILLTSCAHPTGYKHISKYLSANEVVYLSSDLLNIAVFSKEKTRFGPTDLTIANPDWPSFSATYFETGDGVQCISVGKSEISDQYAVKRPLTAGEQYSCLRTTFRVVQCFYDCRAAIIEMNRPLSGNQSGTYQSYMYLDNCRGAIILSETSDLSTGIPLNAEWLRGEIGILAHPDYPKCRPF